MFNQGRTLHNRYKRSQPVLLGGTKMFEFKRTTVFYFGGRFSKHKMTRYAKNLGSIAYGDRQGIYWQY